MRNAITYDVMTGIVYLHLGKVIQYVDGNETNRLYFGDIDDVKGVYTNTSAFRTQFVASNQLLCGVIVYGRYYFVCDYAANTIDEIDMATGVARVFAGSANLILNKHPGVVCRERCARNDTAAVWAAVGVKSIAFDENSGWLYFTSESLNLRSIYGVDVKSGDILYIAGGRAEAWTPNSAPKFRGDATFLTTGGLAVVGPSLYFVTDDALLVIDIPDATASQSVGPSPSNSGSSTASRTLARSSTHTATQTVSWTLTVALTGSAPQTPTSTALRSSTASLLLTATNRATLTTSQTRSVRITLSHSHRPTRSTWQTPSKSAALSTTNRPSLSASHVFSQTETWSLEASHTLTPPPIPTQTMFATLSHGGSLSHSSSRSSEPVSSDSNTVARLSPSVASSSTRSISAQKVRTASSTASWEVPATPSGKPTRSSTLLLPVFPIPMIHVASSSVRVVDLAFVALASQVTQQVAVYLRILRGGWAVQDGTPHSASSQRRLLAISMCAKNCNFTFQLLNASLSSTAKQWYEELFNHHEVACNTTHLRLTFASPKSIIPKSTDVTTNFAGHLSRQCIVGIEHAYRLDEVAFAEALNLQFAVADDRPRIPQVVAVAVVDSAKSSTVAAAATSAMVGNPTIAAQAGRMSLLLALTQCDSEIPSELDFSSHPTGVQLGEGEMAVQVGCVVMNTLLMLVFALVQTSIGFLRWRAASKDFLSSLGDVRFPGLLAVPAMLLVQPTFDAAFTVLVQGTDAGKQLLCVVFLVPWIGIFVALVWFFKKMFEAERKTVDLDPMESLYTALKAFLFGTGKWVPRTPESEQQAADDIASQLLSTPRSAKPSERHEKHRSPFVRLFGLLFVDYTSHAYWFITVEYGMSIACGVLSGIKPTTDTMCEGIAIASCILYCSYAAALVWKRPYFIMFALVVVLPANVIQAVGSIATVVYVFEESDTSLRLATILPVVATYILLVKSFTDFGFMMIDVFNRVMYNWTKHPIFKNSLFDLKGLRSYAPDGVEEEAEEELGSREVAGDQKEVWSGVDIPGAVYDAAAGAWVERPREKWTPSEQSLPSDQSSQDGVRRNPISALRYDSRVILWPPPKEKEGSTTASIQNRSTEADPPPPTTFCSLRSPTGGACL